MFFQRKAAAPRPAPAHSTPDTEPAGAPPRAPAAPSGDVSAVIDALGGVISAIARFPVDLPHRPAADTTREMTAWQRHATLGMPLEESDDGSASVGFHDRDWKGLVRAVAALRRDEQQSVESLVSELRSALWTCVSAVHQAVRIDDTTEASTASQLTLVRKVVSGSQMSTIKDDVLSAISEIDRALKERREEQQRQYKSLANSLDSLGRQLEEARKESETDPLTRVGNRKHFDLMVQRAAQLFSLSRAPMTLLMIDLNKLKVINDSYGHPVGDLAIQSVAGALWKVFLRQSDVICRYGGDEFAVILNGCELPVAQTLAKRLVELVRALPLPSPQMEFALGASVGVAQLAVGEDVAQWVDRADRAMYQAKRHATSGVMVADAGGNCTPTAPAGRERLSA
ncbi:MAG: GGDEF domain-containing protein [Gemmatimonadaceae bacterium]|nr:GGDEF domain-containing protein [Gemmatimonadaceae bacterium]